MSLFCTKCFNGFYLSQSKSWRPYNGLQTLHFMLCTLWLHFLLLSSHPAPAKWPPWCSWNAPGTLPAWNLCTCSCFSLKTLFPYSFAQLATLFPSGFCSNITFPMNLSWWLWHCNPHLLSSIFLHTFNTVYIQYIHVFIYLLPALPVKFILKLTPQGLKALFYSTATSPMVKTATCTKKVLNECF